MWMKDGYWKFSRRPGSASWRARIASQSLILLANDGLLPLTKTTGTLAVIGPNADSWRNLIGDYSYATQLGVFSFHHGARRGAVRG